MPSRRPGWGTKIVLPMLISAMLFACTSDPEPERTSEPTVEPTVASTVEPVVEPSPTVVSTPEPTLADDEPAQVTTVEAGTTIEDPAGNLIAVHGVGTVPDAVLSLRSLELFGDAEELLDPSLVFIDVSWCSAGMLDDSATPPVASVDLSLVAAPDVPLGDPGLLAFRQPLRSPGFVIADPGACSRGWAAVAVPGGDGDPSTARYVYTDPLSSTYEAHVFQWELPAPVELGADPVAGGPEVFRAGQVVTFNEGSLRGTTVTLRGWAELIGVDSPVAETRVVGVLVEVCPANEDWPELGLAIDGWNVVEPLDPADRLGADPFAPLSGNCFEDWAEFGLPFGLAPSGFFVGDGAEPDVGFAIWTLEGAAIAPPG